MNRSTVLWESDRTLVGEQENISMFSTWSEFTPRAPILDGRMEQIMQPWSWQKSTSGARNFGKPWPLANMRIISGPQTRSVSKVQSRIHNAGVQDTTHPWEFEPQRILPTHY